MLLQFAIFQFVSYIATSLATGVPSIFNALLPVNRRVSYKSQGSHAINIHLFGAIPVCSNTVPKPAMNTSRSAINTPSVKPSNPCLESWPEAHIIMAVYSLFVIIFVDCSFSVITVMQLSSRGVAANPLVCLFPVVGLLVGCLVSNYIWKPVKYNLKFPIPQESERTLRITKNCHVQLTTTRSRVFILMVLLSIIQLLRQGAAADPQVYNFLGFQSLFGYAVYAFISYHSIQSLITPMRIKENVFSEVDVVYVMVGAFFVNPSITGFFVVERVRDICTWSFGHDDDKDADCERKRKCEAAGSKNTVHDVPSLALARTTILSCHRKNPVSSFKSTARGSCHHYQETRQIGAHRTSHFTNQS